MPVTEFGAYYELNGIRNKHCRSYAATDEPVSLVVDIKDPRFTMSGLRFWVQLMSGIVSVVTTFLSVLDVANLGSQIMLA